MESLVWFGHGDLIDFNFEHPFALKGPPRDIHPSSVCVLKLQKRVKYVINRAGHALFWSSRSFLALHFVLLHLLFRPLYCFALTLSRSLIFSARTFALLIFRSRNLVRLYLYSPDRIARTGQPRQDSQNRTARTE
jgi:hypothetical protein